MFYTIGEWTRLGNGWLNDKSKSINESKFDIISKKID